MDYDYAEQAVTSGFLSSITFGIVTEEDVVSFLFMYLLFLVNFFEWQ